MNSYLEDPATLLAAHDRLRGNGFPLVSVICARTPLDARVWLGQWAAARGRNIVVAPEAAPEIALAAYVARVPEFSSACRNNSTGENLPSLLLPTRDLLATLPAAVALVEKEGRLPVVLTCGIAGIVEHLLDAAVPLSLVSAALQGLVPVAHTEQQVLKKVADGRQVTPFLRGACEGLVFYMLEARSETRGRFEANRRVYDAQGSRSYEVDIVCAEAKLIIEIDGPEHNRTRQQTMDERKLRDLEAAGYRVRRFRNEQVIDDPVGVWQLISEQLKIIVKPSERRL